MGQIRTSRNRWLVTGSVIVAALGGSAVPGLAQTIRSGAEPMLVARDAAGMEIVPLLTAGEEIPLLVGSYPDMSADEALTYRVPGVFDGMGVIEGADANWVIVQHEQDGDVTDPEDFQKTVFSSTVSGTIPGARISILKFSKDWDIVGGTLLLREFLPTTFLQNEDGEAAIGPGSRMVIDTGAASFSQTGHVASSLCSGTLAMEGFFDPATGQPAPVWFASEEDDGYSGISWAVYLDGTAEPIEGLGVSEKEQTLPLRGHGPAIDGRTMIVVTDDETDGEIYLWIGRPAEDDVNGLHNGQLYAMKIPGAARESGPARLDGVDWSGPSPADAASVVGDVGDRTEITWTAIPDEARVNGDALADFVTGEDDNGGTRATSFLYPEDIDEDPNVPGRLYLAANGGADQTNWDGEEERYENPYSRVYQIDLNIADPDDPSTWKGTITYLLEGGAGKGMSYDNLLADSKGQLLLAEDLNQDAEEADAVWAVLRSEERGPVISSFDIGTGVARIAYELAQERHDPSLGWDRIMGLIDADEEEEARDLDFWEASGMIEVPGEGTADKSAYLIGVQAHSLRPSGLAEGGQLVLVRPAQ